MSIFTNILNIPSITLVKTPTKIAFANSFNTAEKSEIPISNKPLTIIKTIIGIISNSAFFKII